MDCYAGEHRAERMAGKNLGKERTAQQREGMRGRNHFQRIVRRVCLHCGQSYERRGKTQHSGLRFCSKACWYDYIRLHPEANGRYQGGHEPYYGPNWKEQRRKARRRDKYTCQCCGLHQTHPALPVHHIRPRRAFARDEFEAMNDLANLITLCPSCHMAVEANPALLT